jgi:MFS family permease
VTAAVDPDTRRPDSALVAYLFFVVMVVAVLPTPLYAIYARRLGFSALTTTAVFAVYAAAALVSLLTLGRLSDHIGRRAVLVTAAVLAAASALLSLASPSLPALFASRLVSGVAVGLVTGSATAYLAELGRGRGSGSSVVVALVANVGGQAFGTLMSGVLAQFAPSPLRLPYVAGLVLLLPVVGCRVLPETVTDRDGWRAGVRPHIGVPTAIRTPFAGAAIAGLASFAFFGFLTALTDDILVSSLIAGLVVAAMFVASAAAQLAAGSLPARPGGLIGVAALPLGAGCVVAAVVAGSLPLLVVAAVIGGTGAGFAFRSGLAIVTRIAPDDLRGQVTSGFYAASYVGAVVPTVIAGLLTSVSSLFVAALALAIFMGVLASVSATIINRTV